MGNSVTFQLAAGNAGFLSSFNTWDRPPLGARGRVGIPPDLKQWNRFSSQEAVGNTELFSSCGAKLRLPLEWQRVSQGSPLVA